MSLCAIGDNSMKKKTAAAFALASTIALSATFTGCSLVSTNSKADMEQVVATVDISLSDKFEASGLSAYKSAISASSDILKRDLVSYFLNVGYSYVQNGSSYEETFTSLLDSLVNNAVLTQYATCAVIEYRVESGTANALDTFLGFDNDVARFEYLLGGGDSENIKIARYSLYKSLNSAIDNYEKTFIEDDEEYSGTDTRSTPTNVDTQIDDYYPKDKDGNLNYNVYTGYEGYLLKQSGAYQDDALKGTTSATRKKAYNAFINNLRRNNLLQNENEDFKNLLEIGYIKDEYVSQLKNRVVEEYYDIYEEEQEELLKSENYIQNIYDELLENQKGAYAESTAFEAAMDKMSDTAFLLYSPDTSDSDKVFDENAYFGFVYNILLPFSDAQSVKLTELKAVRDADKDDDKFFFERNQLLKNIVTTDQRAAWFNGETDYSFKAGDDLEYFKDKDSKRNYLFFENNLTKPDEYKALNKYIGDYSYNGLVYTNADGSYTLRPNKLNIDDMLNEFCDYVNYALDGTSVDWQRFVGAETDSDEDAFYNRKSFKGDDDEIDYSNFIYATGSLNLGEEFNIADLMVKDNDYYKAMSAVNELQYAYTTDTGILDKYVGYSVSAYDTSYIKEFEFAAKAAIQEGVGSFVVCAGDYGWHLIYVTCVFKPEENGITYTPDWTRIDEEGTFENLFYEWVKSGNLSNVSSTRREKIINDFNKESTVSKYQKRYQDLLDLDS